MMPGQYKTNLGKGVFHMTCTIYRRLFKFDVLFLQLEILVKRSSF